MSERAGNRRRWGRLFIGIGLSAVAFWLALRNTSLSAIGDALGQADWRWLPVMLALKASVLVIKDLRWRCELGAMQPGPYQHTFRAIGLGYFGNIVLPFKMGELLRVGLLKRHNPRVGLADVLATIAAERALDGAILALMVGAMLFSTDVPTWVESGTLLLLVAMLGLIAVAMLAPVHRFFIRKLPERGPLGLGRKVIQALSRGTAVLRKPGPLALATTYTAIAWLGEAAVFYCAIEALGIPLGFGDVLVVTLLLSVGLLIPSAPGQIGTHQALSVLFLEPFGVVDELAVSVSFTLQAVALVTLCSIGGYVLIREAGIRDLVRVSDDSPPSVGDIVQAPSADRDESAVDDAPSQPSVDAAQESP